MAMDIKSSSSKSSSGFLSTSRLLQHESAPEAEFSMGTTPYIASPRSTALKALTSRKEDHGLENFKQIDVDQYVTNIQWSIYWRRMNFLYICRMYILYLTYYISTFTATIKWNNQKIPVWPRHSGKGFDTFLFEIWQMIKEATNCHMCQGAFFTWLKENVCVTLDWLGQVSRFCSFIRVFSLLFLSFEGEITQRGSQIIIWSLPQNTTGSCVAKALELQNLLNKNLYLFKRNKKNSSRKEKNTKHFLFSSNNPPPI